MSPHVWACSRLAHECRRLEPAAVVLRVDSDRARATLDALRDDLARQGIDDGMPWWIPEEPRDSPRAGADRRFEHHVRINFGHPDHENFHAALETVGTIARARAA